MDKQAVSRIEARAAEVQLGTILSFDDLSLIAHTDVKRHRSIIACANRHLLRHHDRCLLNVRGVGYKVEPAFHARMIDLKELVITKEFTITEVSQLDDGKGGSPALLVQYKEGNPGSENRDIDSAVVNHLLGKRK